VNELLSSVVHALVGAESQVLLLARSQPINWATLKIDLEESWKRGDQREPVFEFQPPPNLHSLRAALAQVRDVAASQGIWGTLLGQRAAELELEAQLAEHIGDSEFRCLAVRRFAMAEADSANSLRQQAEDWCRLRIEETTPVGIASDDYSNGSSLVSQLLAEMSNCKVVMPIRLDRHLAAIATVDNQCVWVRPGEFLLAEQARRIAVHEIRGHAVRRIAAAQPTSMVSRGGFAGSDEDEEGRAICLEEEAGLLDQPRKVELGRRFLAARACQRGASFSEAVQLLLSLDTPLKRALGIVFRVWRGGGLARESIYLQAYARAKAAIGDSPLVESWMRRGRFSIRVASLLARGELTLP
jgi:hypothetical protein